MKERIKDTIWSAIFLAIGGAVVALMWLFASVFIIVLSV